MLLRLLNLKYFFKNLSNENEMKHEIEHTYCYLVVTMGLLSALLFFEKWHYYSSSDMPTMI